MYLVWRVPTHMLASVDCLRERSADRCSVFSEGRLRLASDSQSVTPSWTSPFALGGAVSPAPLSGANPVLISASSWGEHCHAAGCSTVIAVQLSPESIATTVPPS